MAVVVVDESNDSELTSEDLHYQNEYSLLFDRGGSISEIEPSSFQDYYPEQVLGSLSYGEKDKTINGLQNYDYIITHSWNPDDDNWYGAISAWYDAFELWNLTTYNSLPTDFGGRKIALLFPDCPNKSSIWKILIALLSKYSFTEKSFKNLCQHIYFIHKPKEILLSKGHLPYENYSPSNLIFVDGKVPKNIPIQVDNIYLSIIDNLKEEDLKYLNYNFLFIYRDKRIFDLSKDKEKYPFVREINIARSNLPNTLIFDDVRRIDFNSFKIFPPKSIEDEDSSELNKKRILLYMTERNKRNQLKEDTNDWTNKQLDDILNSIPKYLLNPLAITIMDKQKELYDFYKERSKKFTPDQLIAIKEKGTIFGNGYNEEDVISEQSKVHFVIVGLTDKNRNFEDALVCRALQRGMNISTSTYLQKDLPIIDIHSKYDWYLFTPMYKWSTSRFIPEALYYKKKILLTKEAKLNLKWNLPLNIRYHDSLKYLMFIAEDDIFKRPRSTLANHIIGKW